MESREKPRNSPRNSDSCQSAKRTKASANAARRTSGFPVGKRLKPLLAPGVGLGQTTYELSNKTYVARYCGPEIPKGSLAEG